MTLKVFSDLHHAALFESLRILFEDRMGAELYRPIGLEWFHQNYWAVYTGPGKEATAGQYLGLDQATNRPTDIRGKLLDDAQCANLHYTIDDGIYYTKDIVVDKTNRAITLDKFKSIRFDIIIASIPAHIPMFLKLRNEFQPQAKLIFQVGNSWHYDSRISNLLSSTAPYIVPANINAVFYHQEFDLNTYRYADPTTCKNVYSFIHYMRGKDTMNRLANQLPEWNFKSFGAGMEDSICKSADIADKMREAGFIFHFKPEGDGFGHSLHGAYAVGRPAIYCGSHYNEKLAGQLMEHNITGIDMEKVGSTELLVQKLKHYEENPNEHLELCHRVRDRFKNIVNFDKEFVKISNFINNLV